MAQLAAGLMTKLLTQHNTQALQLSIIKARILNNNLTMTAAERAHVETVLPYNLDAWDDYPAEREKLHAAAGTQKVISLAGDTHNAWHRNLRATSGRRVGAELACSSASSLGFEQSNQLLIDDLQYLDASRRVYVLATFAATNATAECRYVASLDAESIATTTGKTVV
jgi:alkaline phosphatase D